MTIKLRPVTSSQFTHIGHDPLTNTLAIKFPQGTIYHYQNFTRADYIAFGTAESLGSYFYQHIKSHPEKYPYKKQ